jgi:hypothetical protein
VDAQTVGGTFTVALQIGDASMPGVDHCAGVDIRTTRLPELFSESECSLALEIHNDVVQKRRKPTNGHYLNDIYAAEEIEKNFLRPLAQLHEGNLQETKQAAEFFAKAFGQVRRARERQRSC